MPSTIRQSKNYGNLMACPLKELSSSTIKAIFNLPRRIRFGDTLPYHKIDYHNPN